MDNMHEGIVIVSMSNLFHIFDKERAAESKVFKMAKQPSVKLKKLITKPNFNLISEPSHTDIAFTETSEKSPKKEDRYIIKKKSTCCDYFFNLVLICVLMIFLNGCYIWVIFSIFSKRKNKCYCFDSDSREFKLCESDDFCPISGKRDIIYTDKIYDLSIKTEINNINNKYIDFYSKEATIFSRLNKKLSRQDSTMSKFGVSIISTYKENYLFTNTFRTGCENYVLNIVLSICFGTIIGNIIFGYVGDIFGRKKVIIIAHLVEIIGSLIIILTTYACVNKGIKTKEEFKPFNNSKMFEFDYTKDDYYHIQNFIRYFNLDYFEISNMNKNYKDNFNAFIQEILESKYINNHFKNCRYLINFGFLLIFCSNSSIKSTILAFILENALTEYSMNLYYLYYNFTFPLSLFFSLFMIISLDSFQIFMLVLCILQFILIVIFMIFFYESQRFNFEYAFYTRITDFAIYILGEEKLKKNYSEDFRYNEKSSLEKEKVQIHMYYSRDTKDKYKIKNELNNNEENESCTFMTAFLENEANENIRKNKKENSIKRKYILGNPFSIFSLIKKEKFIKNHFLLVVSFISSLSLVNNISFSKFTSPIFITREKLFTTKTFILSHITLFPIIYIILLFPFIHAFIKCIGLGSILRISLGITLFSSFIYEIICFSSREVTDLTENKYNSIDIIIYKYLNPLTAFIYLTCISCVGIQYSLYFFITKLTKTIYRCTFFGICNIVIDISFVLGLALENTIEKTFAYSNLFALISLIISIFIISNDDSLNITDMREIKFNDKIR